MDAFRRILWFILHTTDGDAFRFQTLTPSFGLAGSFLCRVVFFIDSFCRRSVTVLSQYGIYLNPYSINISIYLLPVAFSHLPGNPCRTQYKIFLPLTARFSKPFWTHGMNTPNLLLWVITLHRRSFLFRLRSTTLFSKDFHPLQTIIEYHAYQRPTP